jgi:dolichol-phosphate mannosyltransferase
VLVVDDDSPDGTYNLVCQLKEKYDNLFIIKGLKKGLGDAYKRGIKYALETFSPNLIIQMDADGQHDPMQIPLFIALSTFGFDVVIGSRFAQGGETPDYSLWRSFLSLFGNWSIRFLGGVPGIHDCTSGYRCLKTDIIKLCDFRFLSTRGYSFQSSLLFELLRNNAKCIEVPIVFRPRFHGKSKLALRDQLEFIVNIAKMRFRKSEEFIKRLLGLEK